MDEILFRSSQRIETMQIQAQLASSKIKELIHLCSQQGRTLVLQAWNSSKLEHLRINIRELIDYLIAVTKEFKQKCFNLADPHKLYVLLVSILGSKWSKRELTLACFGFVLGGIVGLGIGLAIRRKQKVIRYMEAIQINQYRGPESVIVAEDAIAPYRCGDYDVLINVKAASVHIIDTEICCGYGRSYRKILRKLHKQSPSDLPVTLGRDCTGIITDLGKKVKRLEIGDEVWVTVPFWSQGTLCQTVLVSENRVARKPKNVGFEGACSIPYAGSLALSVLNEAGVDAITAQNRRFFIQGGCTPVGCVLVQLLNHWKAETVVTSCYQRAMPVAKALGASDIIVVDDNNDKIEWMIKTIIKELEVREQQYDMIILTQNDKFDWSLLRGFCTNDGCILSSLPQQLLSDSFGVLSRSLLSIYMNIRFIIQDILGLHSEDYDECHLCHVVLDKLAKFVEEGNLQTVVDKVYHSRDIEIALNHIQSPQSIGSTVVTFR